MKTKIFSITAIIAAVIGLSSCSDSWEPKTEKTGDVALSTIGIEVAGAEEVVQGSRAEYDVNPFLVKIYNSQNSVVEQWTYGEMPEIFTLPVGAYTVLVESHEVQKAEWERPYFRGSKEFTIEKSKITDIGTVVCSLASLKVSVRFTDELRAVMGSDVQVKVVANDLGELIYTPEETRAGYFEVLEESPSIAATFTGTVNGYNENVHKVYTDVKGGQHRIITFSLKHDKPVPDPETGLIDPSNGINIDVNVTDENISGNLDIEEDPEHPNRPGENEEFKDKVSFETSLATDKALDPAAVADAKVKVAAPNGIENLIIAISSDNDECSAACANPATFGLPDAASAKGLTELTVDFASLVAKFAEYTGNHSVTLTVTDTQANTVSATYNFKVKGSEPAEAIEFKSALRFDTEMNPAKETDGLVKIIAPAGIAKLLVTIESTNEDFASVTSMISGQDFADPGELKETLDGFGLANGDAVLNQTSVDFNITNFLSLLGDFSGEHRFILTVTDNNGATATRTLIFKV